MKKAIALLLALMMVMSLLAACSSDSESSGTTTSAASNSGGSNSDDSGTSDDTVTAMTLKVWCPEEDMEITYDMCDAFNEAHPEWDITFEISVVGVDESVNNLETDADLAADVFLMPSASIGQLVAEGLIYPITYNIDEVSALYGEGALEACSADGYLYGIPSSPNCFFLYYNKTMYTEEEVQSLETMMAKDLGDGIANFSCDITNGWYIESWFYAAGCTLYGEDGTDPDDCTWNDENGLAAALYIIDMVNNEKYVEEDNSIAGSRFKEGTLGAVCTGTWSYQDFLEALGDDLGACALPTVTINGTTARLSNFADYKCYAVKSNTEYPVAAQALAEWFGNEENQLTRYMENATTPTVLSLMENETVMADIATCALLAQTEYATPQPAISQISEYWTPAAALGEGIINGEINASNIQSYLDTFVTSVTTKLGG